MALDQVFASAVPKNKTLWEKIQQLVKGELKSFRYKGKTVNGPREGKGFKVFPSAYANQWAAKLYKSLGGKWQAEATFLQRLEATAAKDEDIGSGDYALTTDKSGKFWGSAGAGGVFYAEDTGRLLLAYRSGYVNEPHTWGVWGGAVDENETPEQAVKREIREETGYSGSYTLEPIWVYRKGDFRYHNFLIRVPHEFSPKLCWETEGFLWTLPPKSPKPLHFGLKALWPHLIKKL